ncbi:sugar kinase [Massilia sp. Root351]|jgi:fructokinase|uniref:carbohydrate kinase family protein n=1 Tax=Massilia sp. Root351 TaxID=1736522 RepID=UPI000709DA09|nr:carbohydrate kinase [Massilia sp. Root351]KQV90287.1 sugar kinase [Massilia sp. Root351]
MNTPDSADFPAFVAAGEALTDLIRSGPDGWRSLVGGSTWNVARVVASLGVPSAFAGAVSRDVFGAQLAAANAAAGLDGRFLQQLDKAPLLAVVHELDPPNYFFIGDDSADLHFDAALLPQGWQAGARWVHFGGISLARQPLADKLLAMAEDLKRHGVSISYDPNFRALMDRRYDAVLQRMAALADLIKVSDEDLRGLFRTGDAELAFGKLRAMNPDAIYLYTRGADGAQLYQGANCWKAPAPEIAVVDTVGAGDASIGALLYSFIGRPAEKLQSHLRFAVAAGAAACLAPGATPPTLQQVTNLMSSSTGKNAA